MNTPQKTLLKSIFSMPIFLIVACNQNTDTVIDKSLLTVCSEDKISAFEFTKNHTQGVTIFDTIHNDIGRTPAYWAGWAGYYWMPLNGKKRIVGGTLYDFSIYDGQEGLIAGNDSKEEEYDWNLDIVPDGEFSDFLYDVYHVSGTTDEWLSHNGFTAFQAEITPDEHLYDNPWFPNALNGDEHYQPDPVRLNGKICVYGPWIMDLHHNLRPEIHPAEAIWWREQTTATDTYYLFAIQDDSNRYDDFGDFISPMIFDSLPLQPGQMHRTVIPGPLYPKPNFRAWAAFPMTTTFRIPFEYNGQYQDHLVLDIEELKSRNIVTPSQLYSADSDDGKNHKLRFKTKGFQFDGALKPSNILVEVNENFQTGSDLGISFQDICLKPNGNVIGYVQITASYGIRDGEEGYQVLKATMNYPTQKLPNEVGMKDE